MIGNKKKKQEMLNLLRPISSSDDMLKFFKVLIITIVQWPVAMGPFLPGFLKWVEEGEKDDKNKPYPPIVWLYGYLASIEGPKAQGEVDEANSN